jgi:hypothetical protein
MLDPSNCSGPLQGGNSMAAEKRCVCHTIAFECGIIAGDTLMKRQFGVPIVIYDIVIGGALAIFSRGNGYLNLFGGAFIGAALANLFSTLLTTRIELKIAETLNKFDVALDLVQFKFPGARHLDKSTLEYTYQYYKTLTTDGEKWRLTLYEWAGTAGECFANGRSISSDTSGHTNNYYAVMIMIRGCIVIIESDPESDEPSAVNIVRRDVASPRLYGVSRLTTWKSTDAFTPVILARRPIEYWSRPEQDEHGRLYKTLDAMWSQNIRADFLTGVQESI